MFCSSVINDDGLSRKKQYMKWLKLVKMNEKYLRNHLKQEIIFFYFSFKIIDQSLIRVSTQVFILI